MNARRAMPVLLALTALGHVAAAQHEAPRLPPAASPALPAGAIRRMIEDAQPGDTLRIPAGVYAEHLRITKPLTLIADGHVVLDGMGRGDIVEITAPDVTLRGFAIRNTGIDLDKENAAIRVLAPRATIDANTLTDILFGIDLRESPDSIVTNNTIGGKALDSARRGDGLRLWRCDRTLVEGNTIHDGRDAILWYSSGVVIRNNTSARCRYGLHLMFSDDVTITDNTLTHNSVGIYLMYSTGVDIRRNRLIQNRGPSGYGIGLKETDRFRIADNLLVGNRSGAYLDGTPFTQSGYAEFTGNTFALNDAGLTVLPSARGNTFSGNNFIDNIDQVVVAGRGSLSGNRFWAGDEGNFWSDYTGYDQNADGVGDFVHESSTLFENLLEREPSLRLFLFSPAQQAIEFVGRAVPSVRPEPKFTDEVPLMRPVPIRPTAVEASERGPGLALLGAALASLGSAFIAFVRPYRALHHATSGAAT